MKCHGHIFVHKVSFRVLQWITPNLLPAERHRPRDSNADAQSCYQRMWYVNNSWYIVSVGPQCRCTATHNEWFTRLRRLRPVDQRLAPAMWTPKRTKQNFSCSCLVVIAVVVVSCMCIFVCPQTTCRHCFVASASFGPPLSTIAMWWCCCIFHVWARVSVLHLPSANLGVEGNQGNNGGHNLGFFRGTPTTHVWSHMQKVSVLHCNH